ncbi:MAG: TrkH family potassium uptake protein [Clostridiales bacterium]
MKKNVYLKKHNKITPGRFIVLGFALVIIIGALLLLLPISARDGVRVSLIDAFFTSTSAVCVTGLITMDTGDTFSLFGRTVVAVLIQIGGLGITSIGVFLIVLSGKKISMRNRTLVKEALNYTSFTGVISLVRYVIIVTVIIETIGMILSFIVFSQDYPFLEALGYSAFHSIAGFNNAGFDVFGGFKSLLDYKDNVLLNLVTCGLIIFGGIGFFVICEVWDKKHFKKFHLHTKIVLTVTAALLLIGTLLLKACEDITWLGAFFASTSARTAGFVTYPLSDFSNAGIFVLIVLMFIGASPGSTGGGIKTTTFFVLFKSVFSYSADKDCTAFKRKIPREVVRKASVIAALAIGVVCTSTFLLTVLEPDIDFIKILFEVTSAFGTVGLTTGITPDLNTLSKIVLIFTMFIGRLGPFVIASIWFSHTGSLASYVEEGVTVG